MRGAGEQQAPPKPDDGDEENSPVAGGRWHPSEQHPTASGGSDARDGAAFGRLEDKLNGCVGLMAPAGRRKPGSRYLQLLSVPANPASVRLEQLAQSTYYRIAD